MEDSVTQALRRVIELSTDPDELSRQVSSWFGEDMLPHARQLAAEMKGFDWLRQGRPVQPELTSTSRHEHSNRSSLREITMSLLRTPRCLVVTAGAALFLLVLAFPPFVVPLGQGFVNNAGFAFILNPPLAGNLTAVVNSPLLAILALGVIVLTTAAYFIVGGVEAALASVPER